MSFPRSPPQSPDDWKSRGMKTFSTASSRSRSASVASTSSRPFNNINYETSARTYYVELRKYLVHFLAKEAAEGVHPQRASARQKLARLSNLQFHELAMDVYDELMRRNLNDKFVPFLAVREEFHPKRNQARQKLATLPESRFSDLASDVYYELTRRYPHVMDADDTRRPPMPPIPTASTSTSTPRHPLSTASQQQQQPHQQQQPASQATTIVPMKGTINVEPISIKDSSDEDDDEDDEDDHTEFSENSPIGKYAPSTQHQHHHMNNGNNGSNTSSLESYHQKQSSSPSHYQHHENNDKQGDESLDSLMADLGNMVHSRSQNGDSDYNMRKMGNDIENHPNDYDQRIASMTRRIQMLEKENHDLIARRPSREDTDSGNRLLKIQDDYDRLDEQYRTLERNHNDQQEIVRGVKQETAKLMEELENLSNENDKLRNEKQQMDSTNRQLTQEIEDWQVKYQKLQLELRNTKGFSHPETGSLNQNNIMDHILQPTRTGVISYESIISYQAAVEDLLQRARSKTPSDVLTAMKKIVTTCKSITEDVERYESKGSIPLDKQSKLQSLKGPFSSELAHLVAAAKSHVNSMGISPVRLLDMAAGNLTNAVADLVKHVGMVASTSPPGAERVDHSQYRAESPQITPTPGLGSHDLWHQDSSPNKQQATNGDSNNRTMNSKTPSQLAEYLKKETDQIVANIQNLLSALRSTQKIGDVYGIITSIADVVSSVTDTSKDTFTNNAAGLRYRQKGDIVLSDLQQCRDKLIHIRDDSFARSPETSSSAAKRDLAKESYEIAKFVKELIGLVES